MTKSLQYITITLFALASVFFGCTITPNTVVTIHDTLYIPKPVIVIHDTIRIKSKSTHINPAQTVNIGGDSNGEIIQRN